MSEKIDFHFSPHSIQKAAFEAGQNARMQNYCLFHTWSGLMNVFQVKPNQKFNPIIDQIRKQFVQGYRTGK